LHQWLKFILKIHDSIRIENTDELITPKRASPNRAATFWCKPGDRDDRGVRRSGSAATVSDACGCSSQQDGESFLREMLVMGKNFGDAILSHRLHRNAIGRAVTLVGPGVVKSQASEEGLRWASATQ
jgi:hypothetical protein